MTKFASIEQVLVDKIHINRYVSMLIIVGSLDNKTTRFWYNEHDVLIVDFIVSLGLVLLVYLKGAAS